MTWHSLAYVLAPWVSAPGIAVTDLTLDSRRARAGSLFLALSGEHGHGVDYLEEAIANGARAVAWEPAAGVSGERIESACRQSGVVPVVVPHLSREVSALAARFFDEPSDSLTCIGVTGTDGKTTVTQFVARLLDRPERRCGVLGTLGGGFPGELEPLRHTTPDAVELQRWLGRLRDAGAGAVAMEVSSHALVQYRADAVGFDVTVLTGLGRDHLDYHGSAEAYAEAKARLFSLRERATAVVNLDDALGRSLALRLRDRPVLRYSLERTDADLHAEELILTPSGMRMTLRRGREKRRVELPLLGRFNAENVLAAVAALLACGFELGEVAERLDGLLPVPGRMERFTAPHGPLAVVDYAHTPGALEAALRALREHCSGRLWVVFGCGGDRDRGKRALMGAVATRLADRVVLTSDNPRSEPPASIIAEIEGGCDPAPAATMADRREAIQWALARAAADDVVLIAGKGHEDHQHVGGRVIAFSDRAVIRELMGEVA